MAGTRRKNNGRKSSTVVEIHSTIQTLQDHCNMLLSPVIQDEENTKTSATIANNTIPSTKEWGTLKTTKTLPTPVSPPFISPESQERNMSQNLPPPPPYTCAPNMNMLLLNIFRMIQQLNERLERVEHNHEKIPLQTATQIDVSHNEISLWW